MKAIDNFKTRVRAISDFCVGCLEAIRGLTAAINNYNHRVSEVHQDIKKKIEHSVGFLYRAERYQREIERAQSELLRLPPAYRKSCIAAVFMA
jgi:hypothetical protein